MKIVAVSGYFDPLHKGHLEMCEKARQYGDKLVVIVNNDHQSKLKKGRSFMPEYERLKIMRSLSMVDFAILSCDEDRSIAKSLAMLAPDIFYNDGDVLDSSKMPANEREVCEKLKIDMVFGTSGKIQSSSWLIKGISVDEGKKFDIEKNK